MHDGLYASGGRLSEPDLVAIADRIGLDVERFRAELASGVHAARVARDADAARQNGISATPAFFVNGERHDEAFDARSLVEALTSNPAPAD
jgi:predicted DsbA family dithiol-disulfide isomerase